MIPDFDEHGLLPPGIHDCTVPEIEERFCWTTRRKELFAGLSAFIATEWRPLGVSSALCIDGSFVRDKPLPEDVDVVIDIDGSVSDEEAILFTYRLQVMERDRFKNVYQVDVWARHAALKNDLVKFFQYIGDKAAAELRLSRRYNKGILRITK
jgi:hypothetical protein